MTLTKLVQPAAEYQQWSTTVGSGLHDGDIIDIYTSLGNRRARSVTVTTSGNLSVLRFNVCESIFRQYGLEDGYVNAGCGAARPCPVSVGEVEIATPDYVVDAGVSRTWTYSELAVKDIKIVSVLGDLVISVT